MFKNGTRKSENLLWATAFLSFFALGNFDSTLEM